jgi:hypothetical protein
MSKDLNELGERKKELLLESDINRQILALEASQMKLKAVEWRKNLTRAGTVYKWVAPVAGLGFGFLAARKHAKKAAAAAFRRRTGKRSALNIMGLFAPLGVKALRHGFEVWRRSRERATNGA